MRHLCEFILVEFYFSNWIQYKYFNNTKIQAIQISKKEEINLINIPFCVPTRIVVVAPQISFFNYSYLLYSSFNTKQANSFPHFVLKKTIYCISPKHHIQFTAYHCPSSLPPLTHPLRRCVKRKKGARNQEYEPQDGSYYIAKAIFCLI